MRDAVGERSPAGQYLVVLLMVAAVLASGCSATPPPSPEECPPNGPERAACIGRFAAYHHDLGPCWNLTSPEDGACARKVVMAANDPGLCGKMPVDREGMKEECLVYFGALMEGGIGGATATPVIVRQE